MQESLIFQKTELGRYELATRKLGLSNTLRLVLVLIDGRRSIRTLAAFSNTVAQDPTCLEELLKQGMIEVLAEVAIEPPKTAAKTTLALQPSPTELRQEQVNETTPLVSDQKEGYAPAAPRLPLAKKMLVDELRSVLGAESDMACTRVQQVASVEDMLMVLPRLTDLIALYSTRSRGDQTHDQIRDLLL